MFGLIMPREEDLGEEQKKLYRSYYCGLCRCLRDSDGFKGKLALSYDMTFLVLVLSALYAPATEEGSVRCASHPVHAHQTRTNDYTRYAADMNLLLGYYKRLDDARDDKKPLSGALAKMYASRAADVCARYPRQSEAVIRSLEALEALERADEHNPDRCAEAFAGMMSELFVVREDEYAPALRELGRTLGVFIYLCDAVIDLRADIRRERFNPLVSLPVDRFDSMLELAMADCAAVYETLPLCEKLKPVLDNIIYAGVWSVYRMKKRGDA